MTEVFLGEQEDQDFIRSYLAALRKVTPTELFLSPTTKSLVSVLGDDNIIDPSLFTRLTSRALRVFREEYSDDINLVSMKRYFVGEMSEIDELGGFHSSNAVGYHDFYRAGAAVITSSIKIKSRELRTFELARSFLHDSLHHSTFCSFRRLRQASTNQRQAKFLLPAIYREQFGINFRSPSGRSYSSPHLTYKSPHAINLNLLMDGCIVLTVAEVMGRMSGQFNRSKMNKDERAILDDILIAGEYSEPSSYGELFYYQVVSPTQRFLDFWGGDTMRKLVIETMISGKLEEIRSYFDERYGQSGAWEKIFKQPGFTLE